MRLFEIYPPSSLLAAIGLATVLFVAGPIFTAAVAVGIGLGVVGAQLDRV